MKTCCSDVRKKVVLKKEWDSRTVLSGTGHAVTRLTLEAETGLEFPTLCWIGGGRSGTAVGLHYLRVIRVCHVSIIPPVFPIHIPFIYHRCHIILATESIVEENASTDHFLNKISEFCSCFN
jgi:hypothetical protein